ncbi:hypothetical protein B0J12DRAFT_688879 [Macrophomina phaseolina]|uniref:Chromo domain-containing protein n=1 Tax=Macrophomina phaseolina TaxID=35725 RepID=A0ABQ8FU59_9PEZI|nr:hypothetical protein B0J12DRAFT_688879 [Macrophomina phaseolina]
MRVGNVSNLKAHPRRATASATFGKGPVIMPAIKRRLPHTTCAVRRAKRQKEWPAVRILDESPTHYLIDWAGRWDPTWEPKHYANTALITEWEEKRTGAWQDEQTVDSRSAGARREDVWDDKGNIHGRRVDGPNHVRSENNGCDGHPNDDKTSDGFWSAERILRENKTHYLIAWAPSSGTGRKFKPTWEPKENANEELRDEWESMKTRKESGSGKGDDAGKTQETDYTARKRNRGTKACEDRSNLNAKVIESAHKLANLSEGAADANKAGWPKTVNDTDEVVNPNPSLGIASVFTRFSKVITYSKKQRRLPQRPLQRFLPPDSPDSGRESVASDGFECL